MLALQGQGGGLSPPLSRLEGGSSPLAPPLVAPLQVGYRIDPPRKKNAFSMILRCCNTRSAREMNNTVCLLSKYPGLFLFLFKFRLKYKEIQRGKDYDLSEECSMYVLLSDFSFEYLARNFCPLPCGTTIRTSIQLGTNFF